MAGVSWSSGTHDLQGLFLVVDGDLGDARRRQGVGRVGGDVRAPEYDVDALAAQLLHDVVDAGAADADAGADRVDVGVLGQYRDLGAQAGVAGHAHDVDRAVGHLGHLAAEEGDHVFGVGAGDDDLRPAAFLANVDDQTFDAVALAEALARDLLVLGQQGLGAAEVDDPARTVAALDDAADDLALAVLVFLVNDLLLGVAHALDDDLLGALGCDAPQVLDCRRKPMASSSSTLGSCLRASTMRISVSESSTSSTTILNW
jgi:hypothetical protein